MFANPTLYHGFETLLASEEARWQAVDRRDARADGLLYYAVASTGIYCRPICPARRPRRENVSFYPSCEAAERAGFRSCKLCRPKLAARPRLVLLDEPSLGLAPQLVEEIFEIVARLNRETGVAFVVAEQNTNIALRYANYGYILENGRVVMDGEAAALRENEDVKEFYLGLSASGRKSYRDVKFYRRRKRWLA